MKNIFLSLTIIASFSLCMFSCGNKAKTSANDTKEELVDKSGKEYTSAYVCPMHCKGSGSDKAGECPVCKMDYVVNKEHSHDGQNEGHSEHDHDHDHGDHEGHNH